MLGIVLAILPLLTLAFFVRPLGYDIDHFKGVRDSDYVARWGCLALTRTGADAKQGGRNRLATMSED